MDKVCDDNNKYVIKCGNYQIISAVKNNYAILFLLQAQSIINLLIINIIAEDQIHSSVYFYHIHFKKLFLI
jgi:hypothetical protein